MIPAFIYAAKSTTDTHDSIPDQIVDARDVIARNPEWVDYAEPFTDETFSAYTGPRGPALADVMAAAAKAAAEHGEARIVVQRSDRVARGDGRTAPHLVEYVLQGRRAGVQFAAKFDPQAFDAAGGLTMSAVSGDRAHDDSKVKAESVSRGMRRRKTERGLHNGAGIEKLGYRIPRHPDGTIKREAPREIDSAGARLIRRIADAALAGISQKQIARELNDDGVPTNKGGRWRQATVRRILYDPYYAGYLRVDTALRNKTPSADEQLVKGQHEAIISLDEWRRIIEINKRRRTNGDGQPGRTSARNALFTHKHLRCGRCGAAMGARYKPGRKTDWYKYVCATHELDRHACDMPYVDAAAVERAMLDFLETHPGVLASHIHAALESMSESRAVTGDRLAEVERDLAKLDARRDRLAADYRAGDLPANLYTEERETLAAETLAARAQADQLRGRADELTNALDDDQINDAVATVMERIAAVVADAGRIETARNVIRQAWPTIALRYHDGRIDFDLGDVSPGFTAALASTNDYRGLPLLSFMDTPA